MFKRLTNKNKRTCPICSGSEKGLLYQQNFSHNQDVFLIEEYDVVVCKNCGLIFADCIPSQTDFNNYYETMSKYEFGYKGGLVTDDYIEYYTKVVDFLLPYLTDKNLKILDVGCSTGGLLAVFKSKCYNNLLGIDPSPTCAKTAEELYGIKVKTNNIDNFNSEAKFDLIILSAVLEHLVDFKDSLFKIRSLLNDGGLLFIEVPDAERFDLYISAPFQQFSVEHINYFSQYSLRNLLSVFSFTEIKVRQNETKLNSVTEPDIFFLSKLSDRVSDKIIKDHVSEARVSHYITECSKIDSEVKKIIHDKLKDEDKIIIWGVGTHTQRLIGAGLDLSKILFFVDSNSRYAGKKLEGIDIKLPTDIKEDVPILISSYSYQREIAQQIREVLKLNNQIIRIYEKYPTNF